MSESTGGSVPTTFGGKLSYMFPVLFVASLLAVGISFGILWVVKGDLEDKLKKMDEVKAAKVEPTD